MGRTAPLPLMVDQVPIPVGSQYAHGRPYRVARGAAGMDVYALILNKSEMLHAALVGATREIDNLFSGKRDRYGAKPEGGWQKHLCGACGEKVAARFLDHYWSGNLGQFRAPDVAEIQIRTSTSDTGDLILHEEDKDNDRFILVTGIGPRFTVRGWLFAREGKLRKWWRDPAKDRPAFFVPQSELHPMAEFARRLP